ncbi:ankyrin repeat domain-containing protein [Humibacillus xanthopallidus]|uniref:Ankyrin repeat protein n=1 Tax=Humibacillus xanthopallidus TaxID=412689 RepID=A0A543I1I8_9MICO|nr:ankyrin repeat domain-containing protein [Humibacillus xanthopallidus]TQM64415.1 ankyrin repeat protein [Humibacillus xanthopallidus]
MALSLPGNPDLERFRRDARRLQRGARDGAPQALALVARHHPSPAEGGSLTLAEAQLVLARSYGFGSWPRLRAYLRRSEGLRRDPAAFVEEPDDSGADPLERAARSVPALACLRYDGADEPMRWARAGELLERHPGLPEHDVFVAATVGDLEILRRHFDDDPRAATRSGGPFDWPPILYLAYSRVPQGDAVGSARLLLDGGADPDSGYLWQGLPTPFTVLTGIFGEGESGPGRQPRHPAWHELALLLLERGADPNDRQALYNRMFGRDDSHLELLLDHGLGRPAGEVWAHRLGVAAESLEEMMTRQLDWAASHGFARRTALLAAHGFTLDTLDTLDTLRPAVPHAADSPHLDDGRTALHQAALLGDLDLIRELLEAGADPAVVDAVHGTTPAGWAQWGRNVEAERLLREAEARRRARATRTAYGPEGDGRG